MSTLQYKKRSEADGEVVDVYLPLSESNSNKIATIYHHDCANPLMQTHIPLNFATIRDIMGEVLWGLNYDDDDLDTEKEKIYDQEYQKECTKALQERMSIG